LNDEQIILNKPIPIDGYMTPVTLKSIINFHDELYEQSNYQKILINILTHQFQSSFYKGKSSPNLSFSAFDVLIKNHDQVELYISQSINDNYMLSQD